MSFEEAAERVYKDMAETIFDKLASLGKFSQDELDKFVQLSKFLAPNPRKIKRITNLYRAARLLAHKSGALDGAFLSKLLTFLVLMELWPVRMAWILQILDDDEQTEHLLKECSQRSLFQFYKDHTEAHVYDIMLEACPPEMAQAYRRVFTLDSNPELFDELLKDSGIVLGDIGSSTERSGTDLRSFSINFNPAIKLLVEDILKHRSDEESTLVHQSKVFATRSLKPPAKVSPELMHHSQLAEWLRAFNDEDLPTDLVKIVEMRRVDGPTLHSIVTKMDNNALAVIGIKDAFEQHRVFAFWARRHLATKESQAAEESQHGEEGGPTFPATPRRRPPADAQMKEQHGEERAPSSAPPVDAAPRKEQGGGAKEREKQETKEREEQETKEGGTADDGDAKGSANNVDIVTKTKDDKTGQDHIGSLNFSVALAVLIHKAVEVPVVFGVYASWGCGKSFIMDKTILALKILWLHSKMSKDWPEERTKECKDAEKYLNDLLVQDRADLIEVLFRYARMGCPRTLLEAWSVESAKQDKQKSFSDKVDEQWELRYAEYFWQAQILFVVGIAANAVSRLWRSLRNHTFRCSQKPLGEDLLKSVAGMLYSAANPPKGEAGEKCCISSEWFLSGTSGKKKKEEEEKEKEQCDYQMVWWNAWLYSGSDNLWAGLIKALYDAADEYYGSDFSNAQKKARSIAILIQGGFALAFLLLALVWYWIADEVSEGALADLVGSFLSVCGAVGAACGAAWTYFYTASSQAEELVSEIASPNFRNKLGFMAKIKAELLKLGHLLSEPEDLPDVWDYLLPSWLGSWKPTVKAVCQRVVSFKTSCNNHQSVKLVIFVDDLDRCPAEKAMEVLQSLVLLTEGTPFVVLLAIDPRIVVTAVETVNSSFFTTCGISGYEYVDKIVNIPFALPTLVNREKEALCRGFLTGTSREGRSDAALEALVKSSTTIDRDSNLVKADLEGQNFLRSEVGPVLEVLRRHVADLVLDGDLAGGSGLPLLSLRMARCGLGDEGALAVVKLLRDPAVAAHLEVLGLEGNGIGAVGAAALAGVLPTLPALRRLHLEGNGCGGVEEAEALLKAAWEAPLADGSVRAGEAAAAVTMIPDGPRSLSFDRLPRREELPRSLRSLIIHPPQSEWERSQAGGRWDVSTTLAHLDYLEVLTIQNCKDLQGDIVEAVRHMHCLRELSIHGSWRLSGNMSNLPHSLKMFDIEHTLGERNWKTQIASFKEVRPDCTVKTNGS